MTTGMTATNSRRQPTVAYAVCFSSELRQHVQLILSMTAHICAVTHAYIHVCLLSVSIRHPRASRCTLNSYRSALAVSDWRQSQQASPSHRSLSAGRTLQQCLANLSLRLIQSHLRLEGPALSARLRLRRRRLRFRRFRSTRMSHKPGWPGTRQLKRRRLSMRRLRSASSRCATRPLSTSLAYGSGPKDCNLLPLHNGVTQSQLSDRGGTAVSCLLAKSQCTPCNALAGAILI
jgi:hypothetical protein